MRRLFHFYLLLHMVLINNYRIIHISFSRIAKRSEFLIESEARAKSLSRSRPERAKVSASRCESRPGLTNWRLPIRNLPIWNLLRSVNSVFEVSMREQALISSIILYFLKWRTNKMSCISSRNRLQTYTINIYYKLNGSQLTFFLTRVNAQLRVFWLERREKVIVK